MNLNGQNESSEPDELGAAKLEVARAEQALANGMRDVSRAGQAGAKRAMAVVKPVLIAAAVVGGVVWLVRAFRGPRQRAFQLPSAPRGPSILGEATRAAALSLASVAARRVAERMLAPRADNHSIPAGHSDPPREASAR